MRATLVWLVHLLLNLAVNECVYIIVLLLVPTSAPRPLPRRDHSDRAFSLYQRLLVAALIRLVCFIGPKVVAHSAEVERGRGYHDLGPDDETRVLAATFEELLTVAAAALLVLVAAVRRRGRAVRVVGGAEVARLPHHREVHALLGRACSGVAIHVGAEAGAEALIFLGGVYEARVRHDLERLVLVPQ